jgi:predicted ATPase
MIETLAIAGYRSLRDLRLSLGPLTIITGANGAGKSSLYRALRLLADVAQGRLLSSLAAEGGFRSALWAGPERHTQAALRGEGPVEGTVRKGPVSLRLGFASDDWGYAIDLGLAVPNNMLAAFGGDPQIKVEALWTGPQLGRANVVAERRGPSVRVRGEDGSWRQAMTTLSPFDTMMTHGADPREALELLVLRERMRAWRFYDALRTDRVAPARRPQIGTFTPVLAADGGDLAAALQTIFAIGAREDFDEAVSDAFPGAAVSVVYNDDTVFDLEMRQHGLLRPMRTGELSDGTLRFLLLAAALLSPRPPALMALNEPETSLHVSLLPALARLIAKAAAHTQIIVVSHATALVEALLTHAECHMIQLEKRLGETVAAGHDPPTWKWPSR